MLPLLTIAVLSLGLAVPPVAAPAADTGATAVAAAKKKPRKKAKKAKLPTAKQCTPKAVKKLKGKKRKQRQAACAKRKKALAKKKPAAKKPAPATPFPATVPQSSPAAGGSASGADKPGGAFDYAKLDLSQPKYETTKDELMLPMADGRQLYIEVIRPKAPGRFGVILESSPYHGTLYNREGWRILPQPLKPGKTEPQGLTGYFAPRGYAVVMMDLRGTGKSQGCLDHLGQKDASDLKTVVEWAASQGWSNGRVGMVGHSYVGSTPAVAAAQNPKGLVTIVPSAGLASMYDHQYQLGVPWSMQYAGPVYGYQGLALARSLPVLPDGTPEDVRFLLSTGLGTSNTGDNFGKDPQEAGCGLQNNAVMSNEAMVSGRYDSSWHGSRDWAEGVKKWDGKIWTVHGVNDEAARIASLHWLQERGTKPGDKLWIGQWNHGIGFGPNRRGMQWTAALHAWFDKELLQRDIDTGPAVELFMNDAAGDGAAIEKQGEVFQPGAWPVPGTKSLTLFANGDKSLSEAGGADAKNTFSGDAAGWTQERYAASGIYYVSPKVTQDTLLAGVPKLQLEWSQTVPRLHAIATLIDESPNGQLRRISTCAMNPELRSGRSTVSVVKPGERMSLEPPCFAMAHNLKAGHRLRLKVQTSDDDHAPLYANDPQVTVFSGKAGTRITLPVATDKRGLFKDAIDLKSQAFTGSGA